MSQQQPNNPLHGVKLADMVDQLEEFYGWDGLYFHLQFRCFFINPSKKSSLKFLRKHQWARDEFEALYVKFIEGDAPTNEDAVIEEEEPEKRDDGFRNPLY